MTYLRKNSKRKKTSDPVIIEPEIIEPNDLPILRNWFLEHLKSNHSRVAVFLCSGVRLDGQILAYDEETILLHDKESQIVYLDAVVSISAAGKKLVGGQLAVDQGE